MSPTFPALKRWAKLVRPSGTGLSVISFHRIVGKLVLAHTLKRWAELGRRSGPLRNPICSWYRIETFPSYNGRVKPTIYVVEDDPDISRLVRHHLEGASFNVRLYSTGNLVVADAERQRPALFLLDIMVPGKDGLELCRQIRQSVSLASVPVIFLTAKSGEADRVLGLELGADDYIPKPFSPRELVARVKAVLRRFERPLPPLPTKIDEIHIDPGAMTLTVRGKQVPTTATEFRLLDYFMRHAGRVFTRDQLLDSVWRDTAYVTPRSVDVYVRRIREKIEPDPENPRYLKTVRGAGYRFEVAR
jgi:DNA-binding response OmpR family regulator